LFDGISCGRLALDKLGIDCEYHAYEIDERAKLVSKSNYPNSHYYSDVFQCDGNNFKGIDLLIGGSPVKIYQQP
jgi:site-specific DNA-cytosine methylase